MSDQSEHDDGAEIRSKVESLIRDVPDYPERGVVFKDISPVLADGAAFGEVIEWMAGPYTDTVDVVAAVEARGFILGAAVAHVIGAGFVPVRKMGKLPGVTVSEAYALEYGEGTLEIQEDALFAGQRVLVVDDVIATGGTIRATTELVLRSGARVAGIAALLSIGALGGVRRLSEFEHRVLIAA